MTPLQGGGIFDGVASFNGRVLVTILLLGVLAAAAWGAREIRTRFGSGWHRRIGNALIALTLLAVGLGVGAATLALWNVSLLDLFASPGQAIDVATQGVLTVVLIVGTYLFTGIVKRFVYDVTEDRSAVTQHQRELVFRSTQVSLYVLAIVVIFAVWNVQIGGLLVGAGFLGIVVGLAARQTLGSLIAGFVLMFARPFEIGDWVQVGDREGIVTEISIVNTRIQTFDGEYAMLPNDVVGSSEIVNRTRKGRLRIHVDVGVDYDTDLEHAVDVATEAMDDVDAILTVPQPQVVLKEFDASSIVLGLRFWIDKPSSRRRWRAQTAVIRAVKAAFDREGIKIPFPQRELMGRLEEGGFRLADEPPEAEVTPDGGADGSG